MAKDDRVRDDGKVEADRRSFLKLAGLGAVASGATIVAGEAAAVEASSQKASGYRETEHVKTFYKTARF
ncbi:twin-arginine translocation signal domain-containing protein [Stappia sp. F7233]|uniref:Twin-arginine translocation signal domain-containing protein n=1 Tax=Stappia albiluteola TaxID=2758565 RepID=A0A839AAC9_9HYPH|nr:twin-arginine translocation signal domain-containing protein [Stappia albiluteola]MBA5776610.1 twin-arginine translocation signal domain-containing protein [Stappia albiluteola]